MFNINYARIVMLLMALLLLCSCDHSQGAGKSMENTILEKRITEYYSHEMSEDWQKTYEYHLPEYQSAVEKDYYIDQMTKDNAGWKLIKFKVNDLRVVGNEGYVFIKFVESAPPSFYENIKLTIPKNNNITSEIVTKWRMKNNTWYVVEAGTRVRLTLNIAIIP